MTDYPDLALYIDGRWRQGSDGSGEDVINPANEAVLGHLPHASAADLDEAVAAAEKGLAVWRKTPSFQRAQIMHRAAALIRDRQESIATALTLEEVLSHKFRCLPNHGAVASGNGKDQLSRSSLPARDHPACCLVVFSIPAEFSGCRGSPF